MFEVHRQNHSAHLLVFEREMGNTITGTRTAKVMKVDGTTYRIKPPATAGGVLAKHHGHHLLDSTDVKHLGIRAPPLRPSHPLKSGKVYFLVELPCFPNSRNTRRAWSGQLHVSAKDRLESLKLSRRSVSDLSLSKPIPPPSPPPPQALAAPATSAEIRSEDPMQVRVRLPRAQVAKLMEESFDPADAAAKIVNLFLARKTAASATASLPPLTVVEPGPTRKEKRIRFMVRQDQVVL